MAINNAGQYWDFIFQHTMLKAEMQTFSACTAVLQLSEAIAVEPNELICFPYLSYENMASREAGILFGKALSPVNDI